MDQIIWIKVMEIRVWLQTEVRECGIGLRPRLNAGPMWHIAPKRWHMRLAALYRPWTFYWYTMNGFWEPLSLTAVQYHYRCTASLTYIFC